MEEMNTTNGQMSPPPHSPEMPAAANNAPPVPATPPPPPVPGPTGNGPSQPPPPPAPASPPLPSPPPQSPEPPPQTLPPPQQLSEGIPPPPLPPATQSPVLPAPKKRIRKFLRDGLQKTILLSCTIVIWTLRHAAILYAGQPSLPVQPVTGQQEGPLSLRTHRKAFVLAFLFFACVYLFIFREVLWSIPAIFRGDVVLNTSELVPIFDWHSQFLDQLTRDFSDLTNSFEFRVRYSVLTTWIRYYKILPFAIILAPLLFSYLAFLAVTVFLSKVDPSAKPRPLIRASAFSVLLINLILLQAKITNFYTLVLGFNLFAVSLIFLIRGVFLPDEKHSRSLLVASALTIINPAVHYLVLYAVSIIFVCLAAIIIHRHNDYADNRNIAMRIMKAIFFAICIAFLPYAAFVKFFVLHGVTNLADVVPDSFKTIQGNSPSLFHQLSLETGSVTGNYLSGSYLPTAPRLAKAFYLLLAILPLSMLFGINHKSTNSNKKILSVMGVMLTISLWCGLGYSMQSIVPTFHGMIAAIFNGTYVIHSTISDLIALAISTVFQILRYPDRFQFISFTMIMILLPLGIVSIEEKVRSFLPPRLYGKCRTTWWSVLSILLSFVIFFLPLFSLWEYRVSLFSGDFGGFLKPYPVSALRDIRTAMDALPSGRTVVLPSAETARLVLDSEGTTHKFIDKFYIYYLNRPSYQYGTSGDIANKDAFFLLYQSLNDGQHWWINILRSLGVRYVVLNRELVPAPAGGPTYLTSIEQSLNRQLPGMPSLFRKVIENKSFTLYELLDRRKPAALNLLIDLDWKSYTCLLENNLSLTAKYNLIPLSATDIDFSQKKMQILTNDKEKASLDLYAKIHPESFSRPDQSSFAFNPDHIPSSQYFNTIFPMLNLLQATKYNIMKIVMPGPFDTLTSTFVGLPTQTTIRFPVDAPKDEVYAVYLRGVFTKNSLTMQWGGFNDILRTIDEKDTRTLYANADSFSGSNPTYVNPSKYSQKDLEGLIPQKIMPVSNQFSFVRLGTIRAKQGKDWLYLKKTDKNPMVVEGILMVKVQDEKQTFTPPANIQFVTPEKFSP